MSGKKSGLLSRIGRFVFLLYTQLSACQTADGSSTFRGLGHVNSRRDTLTVTFELRPPTSEDPSVSAIKNSSRRRKKKSMQEITIQVDLLQDTTALRSRTGDTGSVLWRASIALAEVILQEQHYPAGEPFLDPTALANAHVLELGSGTGLLGVLLSPMVRRYTVTDISVLLPLIRKNIILSYPDWPKPSAKGGNITVEELDWVALQSMPFAARAKYVPYIDDGSPDLVLLVDCIYNPSLLLPLVETLDYISGHATTVVVVSELRAEDVVRSFLELWTTRPGWKLWRTGNSVLGMPYVVWLGTKQG
ncbi:hypothetical protein GLOTRDRAFT_105536 [Gloeophyllum trabeum ATCC 11539]|uniref:S-adenosyl-L-methionine-dependent methyltransferase n=1 Tax=Gloeophyllum trabeum (strain ATCC 11539 / FP-39264 / Madison 617) TaxID=670483 RepID=S7QBI4_GLOTA|nr:uncharacterized protein GLOTRDRAFT_105536 [Gloeophyllum trabeum ATCC 11539]EPQ56723.1 hypothetical protein GLOTRDRAFT_105536 [Gloeophyllum trabeum ATCC 11539]